MKFNIRQIVGNWDLGFVLDKHVLSSTYIGDNQYGHPEFNTQRSEAGEALYQLKYRADWSQTVPIATALAANIIPRFEKLSLIIPMPASNVRIKQPVTEVAKELGKQLGIGVFEEIIAKSTQPGTTQQLKNLNSKEAKVAALAGRFALNDAITNNGCWNALLLDDLYDTGASMEAACNVLRTYPKIKNLYVAAISWK